MGLDMNLNLTMYVSGWSHALHNPAYEPIIEVLDLADYTISESPWVNVSVPVAYWQKANAIHNWFVQNVQDGVDDCGNYYVSYEQLQELQTTCAEALMAYNDGDLVKAEEILPPTSGFFFESTEVDEYYKQDLEKTILAIDKIQPLIEAGHSFEYHSSW